MATVLPAHGCCRWHSAPKYRRCTGTESFRYSRSMSNLEHPKHGVKANYSSATRGLLLQCAVAPLHSAGHGIGISGSSSKMATTEIVVCDGSRRTVNSSLQLIMEKKLEPRNYLTLDEDLNWTKDDYNVWQRTIDVWSCVLSLCLRNHLDNANWTYTDGFTEEKLSAEEFGVLLLFLEYEVDLLIDQRIRRKKTASWLREQALQLGPTFIKVGQLSSTRTDLFPREFVDELAKLQDRVPVFSPAKAKEFIESELGSPIEVLFKEFEDWPVGSASLGQVHRAILHNGERVVVKVQRPGLKKLFDIDLGNMKIIAEYFHRNSILGGPISDWIGLYNECSKILYQEIDYTNEGKNADQFRRNFRNIKWVRIPHVHWDYTTKKVLTMEYVPGIKVDSLDQIDVLGYSRSVVASLAVKSYIIQILKTGFFHADPHPGNLAVDKDGSIIYYDFGMMGGINSFSRERLLELFFAILEKNAKKVVKCLIVLGMLQTTGDLAPVRRSVQLILDGVFSQATEEQISPAVGQDLFATAIWQSLRFPSSIAFILRALSTLGGLVHTLDPDLSLLEIAASFAQELQLDRALSAEELRKQDDVEDSSASMPNRIQRIEQFVKELESGDTMLNVRVPESERAASRASKLQMATMCTAAGGALFNVGVTLSILGNQTFARASFVSAGVLMAFVLRSMKSVKETEESDKTLQ